MLTSLVNQLEKICFERRHATLGVLILLTLLMGYFALQLRMSAGFEKQLPIGHEYTETFQQYRSELLGANRLTVVMKARDGTIWDKQALQHLYDVTQAVIYLPGIDRLSVTSLWTPNVYAKEITEEGFKADPLIPGDITAENLTDDQIAVIRRLTGVGGYVGQLVSRDHSSAMISADLLERDPATGEKLNYIELNQIIEDKLRKPFENDQFEIQIIGFAKQIGDIAVGGQSVLIFCAIAVLLTAIAVFWYSGSFWLTLLPILCSGASLVWQFGTLTLIGYGLDPLAILVPFLVFAIGVSHGVQQINYIVHGLSKGESAYDAARASFRGLLIPGTMALVTTFVSFITLLLIPIPMVKELAITASIGVGYKVITNLIMLPVAASFLKFDQSYAEKQMQRRETRAVWLRKFSHIAEWRNAVITAAIVGLVLATAIWQSQGRHVGTLQPGAPELHADSRFNLDSVAISENFDLGLDWLTVVFAAPPDSCGKPEFMMMVDDFAWHMDNHPNVLSTLALPANVKLYNEGYSEGNPKMAAIPSDDRELGYLVSDQEALKGIGNKDCSMMAVNMFLTDHKAVTLKSILAAAKDYRATNNLEGVTIRLASGNGGVIAATNEEVEHRELPMMLYVYAAILILVFLTYRDFRAMIACVFPLTVGTFLGYWFMKANVIGLTVATLPVMVLAVGIGVDYAFYIYNRLQLHLARKENIITALEKSLQEVGIATIFTAVTLALGVATWSMSELKFQADMGKLLTFMFLINMVMAVTALPALAVILERVFPRKKPVRLPGVMHD